ncbi:MAG: DUF917 domain-containing protein [Chloroflexi bacterium]|nr:DUF917 domain-containing protein [Chloroflexota bacterium]
MSSGPVHYGLAGVARTTLTETDIDDLRVGAWILGTGGGGDPTYGNLCLKKLYAQGRVVEVIDPMDLPDDAHVAAVNQMGSPLPAEERLTDPATVTRAIREMEAYAGIRFTAVMPWEIGGGNAFQPLMAAAMLGLPVVDADAMGRAFPEAQMTSFAVKDFTCHPLVMADIRPNTVIISEAADWKWLERLRRRACTELGAVAATCNPPRTGHEVKTGSHLYTVDKALRIGQTVRRAKAAHRDPVAELLKQEGGIALLRGKVTDVERQTTGGYLRGRLDIAGLDAHTGATMRIAFQNEFTVAWRDDEPCATTPDLICVLDQDSGEAIGTEVVRFGQRVAVVALPAPEMLLSERGLELTGPRAFGHDLDYHPLFTR